MSQKKQAVVNSITVSSTQLNNIRLNALSNIPNAKQSKKEILRKMSHERASKWGNTIEALREQKLRQKQLKREEEEASLRALDEKEELLRKQKQKIMRERAKKYRQEQSDEIRKFKSKLLMADIVHQREQQLKIKKYQESMIKTLDQKYLGQTLETMKAFDDKENEKRMIAKQKQRETQKIIETQLKELEVRKEKEANEQNEQAKYLIGIAKEEERKGIEREEQRVKHIKKIQKEQTLWLNEQIKQKKQKKQSQSSKMKKLQNMRQKKSELKIFEKKKNKNDMRKSSEFDKD